MQQRGDCRDDHGRARAHGCERPTCLCRGGCRGKPQYPRRVNHSRTRDGRKGVATGRAAQGARLYAAQRRVVPLVGIAGMPLTPRDWGGRGNCRGARLYTEFGRTGLYCVTERRGGGDGLGTAARFCHIDLEEPALKRLMWTPRLRLKLQPFRDNSDGHIRCGLDDQGQTRVPGDATYSARSSVQPPLDQLWVTSWFPLAGPTELSTRGTTGPLLA